MKLEPCEIDSSSSVKLILINAALSPNYIIINFCNNDIRNQINKDGARQQRG